MRARDGQSGWSAWLMSWNLGVVGRSGRLPLRNCEDWMSCRRTSRCSGRSRRREIGVTSTNRSCGARAAERQGVRRSDDGGGRFLGGSSSTRKMVTTTGALAAGGARQPGDAGSRWAIGVAGVAEAVDSRRCREIGSASSEKLRELVVLPSNKPLQRTQSPQGNSSNINEPPVRRPRR